MIDKKQLRKYICDRKKEFTKEELREKSASIIRQLELFPYFISAKNILLYWSMSDEVNTQELIVNYAERKNIFLPVMCDCDLKIKRFRGTEFIRCENPLGVHEPQDDPRDFPIEEIDLVIVPGMAFDTKGRRLGRGKGYYDRLLSDYEGYKLGICFDFQLVEEVPAQEHDVRMNGVIY